MDDRLIEIMNQELLVTSWPKMSDGIYKYAKFECFCRIDDRAIDEGLEVPISKVMDYIDHYRSIMEGSEYMMERSFDLMNIPVEEVSGIVWGPRPELVEFEIEGKDAKA